MTEDKVFDVDKLREELLSIPFPKYTCTVCGEVMDEVLMVVFTHLVGHVADLVIRVDRVLESIE